MTAIDILFTADENYAVHIPVVLKSIKINDPQTSYHVHMIHGPMAQDVLDHLNAYCKMLGYGFNNYEVPEKLFGEMPVNKHYSKAMYYRILAGEILPKSCKRMLYLDPDVLVINSLAPLWKLTLGSKTFAAASHIMEEGVINNINQLRLRTDAIYYNTGVLLMDLNLMRKLVVREEVFSFLRQNSSRLLLPDQDVFNSLFWREVQQIPDELWNYDVRKYSPRYLMSGGSLNETWIIEHTAILHYCGKAKPWNASYRYRFGNLYRHYQHLYKKDVQSICIENRMSPRL